MKRLIAVIAVTSFAAIGFSTNGWTGPEHDHSKAKIGQMAPNFILSDVNGQEHELADYRGKFIVLEWTNMECPFVQKHYKSGNMQKLQETYTKKGVVWLRICSSAEGTQGYYDAKTIQTHIKDDKARQTAYLIDADGRTGRLYGAKATPHMYVIDPDGNLIYAGAIDDKPSTDLGSIDGAKNYVSAALDAAMAGKPVETKTTEAYGCSVKYAKAENI